MKSIRRIVYRWISNTFMGGCSSYNSLAVRKSCRSKLQARDMFASHGIPHAQGTTFVGFIKPIIFARRYGFPLVIKPNVSGFSRGSYFPIKTYGQLLKFSIMVKMWWPVSVIEQYLEGHNYRVVVVKSGIMSVIRRYPPFVVGDGSSTIKELIDGENTARQKMKLYPTIQPISKGAKTRNYLKKQGLDLGSVPKVNVTVTLYNRISLAPGGVIETIKKETVHPDNVALMRNTLALFGANILGVDAIFEEGIEKSYKEQNCILLEVNSRPYLKMHAVPRYGEKEDLSAYYRELDKLEVDQIDVY